MLLAAAAALGIYVPCALALTCSAGTCSTSFTFTGSLQEWTVPKAITSLTFTVKGAGGGAYVGDKGGSGAKVISTFAVSEAEKLKLLVGGGGSLYLSSGFGGGGAGGGALEEDGAGGGGGSFAFTEGGSLMIAAGAGGGGAGLDADGGNAGHAGAPGVAAGASGGGGATTSAGGSAGQNAQSGGGPTVSATIEGHGGEGATSFTNGGGGGGGGGGYYGGGGGGSLGNGQDGGGGGGSSTVIGGSSTTYEAGGGGAGGNEVENGQNGEITISFPQPAMSTSLQASSTAPPVGATVTYTATVSPAPTSGTVAFSDDGTPISACATEPVNPITGRATCEVTYNAAGAHTIIAAYSGSTDSIFRAATSAGETVVATQPTTSAGETAVATQPTTSVGETAVTTRPTTTASAAAPPHPDLQVLTKEPKALINTHKIPVRVTCGEAACTVTASASVALPGTHRVLSLPSATMPLTASTQRDIELLVPRALRRVVRPFLLHHPHDRLELNVHVTMTAPGPTQSRTLVLPIWTLPGFR